MADARTGSAAAYRELWRQLAPAVVSYARARGASEPEDVTSEVFLAVFTGMASFEGDEAAFRSWVFTIAHRRCVDDWRRRSRLALVGYEPGADDRVVASAEEEALSDPAGRGVVQAMAGLSAEQRDVLLLRVLGDLTVEQVASVLGKRPGAVKALQRRALAALRRNFAEAVPL